MFRHCVLMKFEEAATPGQRTAALEGIQALPEHIPVIRTLTVGPDAGLREGNFDLAVVADFDDEDAYAVYAAHPAHVEMLTEVVVPILAERAAVQFRT